MMSYYRQPSISFGPPLTRMVKYLIIFTSTVFLVTFLPNQLLGWTFAYDYFSLIPYAVTHFVPVAGGLKLPFIWQPVTYLFLHGGWWHIVLNLLFLWMFGADLERLWGPRQFLFYFFFTGIGARLFNVLLEPSARTPTVGNSGAIFGILLAYGLLFPDRPIFLWFVIPVKAKWFVLGMGLIEFINSLNGPGSGVAHVAHLGGMVFGYLYLRGGGMPYRWQLKYHEWRRARLRRKFEIYMTKQDKKKDQQGPWIN
jgi:rhomboid family protein